MPSTRSQPLNPRIVAAPVAAPPIAKPLVAVAAPSPVVNAPPSSLPPRRPAAPASPSPATAEDRARAGGFHESSYELKNGLEVNESEWPPDTTIPGALGPR
jgi:hypothetical protein